MTLLCRDHAGYLNLSQLISRGWLEGHRPEGGVAVHPDWVRDHHKNLFALIGRHSLAGQLLAKGRADLAEQQLADWQRVFGDGLHLELTRTGRDGEEPFNQFALQVAGIRGIPVIASNDVRFLVQSDFLAHEARVCIASGRMLDDPKRPRTYSEQQYLRSSEEMAALFADIPDAWTTPAPWHNAAISRCGWGPISYLTTPFPTTKRWTVGSANSRMKVWKHAY